MDLTGQAYPVSRRDVRQRVVRLENLRTWRDLDCFTGLLDFVREESRVKSRMELSASLTKVHSKNASHPDRKPR